MRFKRVKSVEGGLNDGIEILRSTIDQVSEVITGFGKASLRDRIMQTSHRLSHERRGAEAFELLTDILRVYLNRGNESAAHACDLIRDLLAGPRAWPGEVACSALVTILRQDDRSGVRKILTCGPTLIRESVLTHAEKVLPSE